MSLVVYGWIASFVLLVSLSLFGIMKGKALPHHASARGVFLRDLAAVGHVCEEAVFHMLTAVYHGLGKVFGLLAHVSARMSNLFAEVVHGRRRDFERGRAASFFLKHIAEHKATTREENGAAHYDSGFTERTEAHHRSAPPSGRE